MFCQNGTSCLLRIFPHFLPLGFCRLILIQMNYLLYEKGDRAKLRDVRFIGQRGPSVGGECADSKTPVSSLFKLIPGLPIFPNIILSSRFNFNREIRGHVFQNEKWNRIISHGSLSHQVSI